MNTLKIKEVLDLIGVPWYNEQDLGFEITNKEDKV